MEGEVTQGLLRLPARFLAFTVKICTKPQSFGADLGR